MMAEVTVRPQSQPRLPDGWRWVRLGEIGDIVAGVTLGRKLPVGQTRSVPYLRVANVKDGFLDLADVYETEATAPEIERCRLQWGDLLLTEGGDPDKLGRGTCWTEQLAECIHQNHIFRVRFDLDAISPWFISAQVASPFGKAYFLARAKRTTGIATINQQVLAALPLMVPPLAEQQRIAAMVTEQMAAVERARAAAEEQLGLMDALVASYLWQSLESPLARRFRLADCLEEVSRGIGPAWAEYRLVGATRAGIAPAKEAVGKAPERYKLVDRGTIFYNPMRILLGSIAMIDEDEEPGITSPDYVVFKTQPGMLHPRWFYHWLRSSWGDAFIKTLARGAVRERMLFRRLAEAEVTIPPWPLQLDIAAKLKDITMVRRPAQAQLDAINQLPATLLRQAFTGGL